MIAYPCRKCSRITQIVSEIAHMTVAVFIFKKEIRNVRYSIRLKSTIDRLIRVLALIWGRMQPTVSENHLRQITVLRSVWKLSSRESRHEELMDNSRCYRPSCILYCLLISDQCWSLFCLCFSSSTVNLTALSLILCACQP